MAVDEQNDVTFANADGDRRDPVARAAGKDFDASDDEIVEDATAWLLSALTDPPTVTNRLVVNVGGVGSERKEVAWVIQSLPGKMIRKIREDAEATVRRGGNTGAGSTMASFAANVRIVVEGSASPDIKAVARQSGVADPGVVLEEALNHKQGLIDQIAGSILQLSGYDNDDVRDAIEVTAAGNSSGPMGS